MSSFDRAFTYVVGEEGDLSMDPSDSGNWTGRSINVGELKGTKYGISAASYPLLDIANLTLDKAKAIYWSDYWLAAGCSTYTPSVAFEMFDCAVNEGVGTAKKILQAALGVTADGVIGPETMTALRLADPYALAVEFYNQRIAKYKQAAGWEEYGKGWARRAADTRDEASNLI